MHSEPAMVFYQTLTPEIMQGASVGILNISAEAVHP